MRKLSHNERRAVVGVALIAALIVWSNYFFATNWFGKFDRDVALIGFLFLLFAVVYVGPGAEEIEKRQKRRGDDGSD